MQGRHAKVGTYNLFLHALAELLVGRIIILHSHSFEAFLKATGQHHACKQNEGENGYGAFQNIDNHGIAPNDPVE